MVHNAAAQLPASAMANVAAAVVFGDPSKLPVALALIWGCAFPFHFSSRELIMAKENGTAVQGVSAAKTKIICHTGDNICQGGSSVTLAHMTYGLDGGAAADFVVSVAP